MKEINIFILLTQIHFILLTQNHFCLSTFNRNFQILQLKLKYLDSFHPIFYRGIERRWLLTKFYRSEDTSFLDCFITPLYPPLFFHFTLLFFFFIFFRSRYRCSLPLLFFIPCSCFARPHFSFLYCFTPPLLNCSSLFSTTRFYSASFLTTVLFLSCHFSTETPRFTYAVL